ncbi:sensor histidine kinase [Profundibacterium mesophilum]|uniref:histidine kinase n=1 Tax=Profundibacterium mesophilum KAUST100406-0324 TaxID=1037889 RepID=A0A921TCT2_9RHOB|nr:PAS domain-containing protein [Profundibacterium mesophilum]KAF0676048.1 two-component system chemotaxis family CheBCheR fusion protein [Profundibacterium mesophilum KAUST100406-0324]
MTGAERHGGCGPLSGAFAAELLEDAPCGIAVSDPAGRLTYVNATLSAWTGRHAAEIETIGGLFTKAGQIFYDTHMEPMLLLQGYVREISCHLRGPNGPCPVVVSAVARHDEAGAIVRCDYTLFDARERHGYESALRHAQREAEDLAAIVRNASNAILRVGEDGHVLSWNRGACTLFEEDEKSGIGKRIEDLVALQDRSSWHAEGRLQLSKGPQEELLFEARDQHETDLEISLTLAMSEPGSGTARDTVVTLRDISERKNVERHLIDLAREMNSRVSTMLDMVTGIARQSLPPEIAGEFISRISVLARTHDMLSSNRWTRVDLHSILNFALSEAGGPERFRFSGPAVSVSPQQATCLSVALNELVSNALQHGALSRPSGRVDIEYDLATGEHLCIRWSERGGPVVVAPTRAGFGARMLETVLARDCDAKVDFDFQPEGFRCRMRLPLESGI